jgi:hypothetical protein
MKLLLSDISTNLIIHNDLEHYVESGYGGKDIKKWPFYRFIKIWINGNYEQAHSLWVNWLVDEFFKHCLKAKSKGGMYHGSVHRLAIENMQKNKNECWLNPYLLNRANVKQGASALVNRRTQLIDSIMNKGYQIDMDDPIIAVKNNGMYVLKGGHHRAAVVYILGYKKLPGVIVYSKPLWECRKWLIKIKRYLK